MMIADPGIAGDRRRRRRGSGLPPRSPARPDRSWRRDQLGLMCCRHPVTVSSPPSMTWIDGDDMAGRIDDERNGVARTRSCWSTCPGICGIRDLHGMPCGARLAARWRRPSCLRWRCSPRPASLTCHQIEANLATWSPAPENGNGGMAISAARTTGGTLRAEGGHRQEAAETLALPAPALLEAHRGP